MKRILVSIALFSLLAGLVSSCKSHERCPAYGQIEKVDSNSERV